MTPRGHFVSLTKQLKSYSRYNDADGLKSYMRGPAWKHFMGLLDDPDQLWVAFRAASEATAKCRAVLDQKAPIAPLGTRRMRWDEHAIKRFQGAYRTGGLEGGARALGITRKAAERAASRYCREPLQPKNA